MWMWLKSTLSQAMVAAGVDWPNVPDGDKLNAIVGTNIGAIGIAAGILGYRLTRRQAQIAEIQYKIFEDQRARRAHIELATQATQLTPTEVTWELGAANTGTRLISLRWYWRLSFPIPENGGSRTFKSKSLAETLLHYAY